MACLRVGLGASDLREQDPSPGIGGLLGARTAVRAPCVVLTCAITATKPSLSYLRESRKAVIPGTCPSAFTAGAAVCCCACWAAEHLRLMDAGAAIGLVWLLMGAGEMGTLGSVGRV